MKSMSIGMTTMITHRLHLRNVILCVIVTAIRVDAVESECIHACKSIDVFKTIFLSGVSNL